MLAIYCNHIPGRIAYNLICIYGGFYLYFLSTKWKNVMTQWYKYEKIFLSPPYSKFDDKTLRWKVNLYALILVLLSISKSLFSVWLINFRTFIFSWSLYLIFGCIFEACQVDWRLWGRETWLLEKLFCCRTTSNFIRLSFPQIWDTFPGSMFII